MPCDACDDWRLRTTQRLENAKGDPVECGEVTNEQLTALLDHLRPQIQAIVYARLRSDLTDVDLERLMADCFYAIRSELGDYLADPDFDIHIAVAYLCFAYTVAGLEPGGVYGLITDTDLALPIAGVAISLVREGETYNHIYSDGDGTYKMPDVPAGHYQARATALDGRSGILPDVWVRSGLWAEANLALSS